MTRAEQIAAEARRIERRDAIMNAAKIIGGVILIALIACAVGIGLGFGASAGSLIAAHLGGVPIDTN